MTTISPCPWCGTQAKVRGSQSTDYWVYCADFERCNARGPVWPTAAEAIKAWNAVALLRRIHQRLLDNLDLLNTASAYDWHRIDKLRAALTRIVRLVESLPPRARKDFDECLREAYLAAKA